jgi:hypothetical protein
MLAAGAESLETVLMGPLKRGDMGEVLENDGSETPFKVKAITGASVGTEWWYNTNAISTKMTEPDVGDVVERGPDWKWDNQDGGF